MFYVLVYTIYFVQFISFSNFRLNFTFIKECKVFYSPKKSEDIPIETTKEAFAVTAKYLHDVVGDKVTARKIHSTLFGQ